MIFGLLPLVLGACCLHALKNLRGSGEQEDRLSLSVVSHAFGLASGALLLLLVLFAVTIGLEPGAEWIGLVLLSSSAFTALASIALSVAARRSRTYNAGAGMSRRNWGWIIAGLLLAFYTGVTAYNVRWHLRYERYKTSERILIRNGLILELDRLAHGTYLSPGFSGTLMEVRAAGHAAGAPELEPLDGWGRPILYSCSADGQRYEMVSTGANGSTEPRIGSEGEDFGNDLDQDVVFADGRFRRYRWGGWCGTIDLQGTSKEEMEGWLQQLHRN